MAVDLGTIFAAVRLNLGGLRGDVNTAKAQMKSMADDFKYISAIQFGERASRDVKILTGELKRLTETAKFYRQQILQIPDPTSAKGIAAIKELEGELAKVQARIQQVSSVMGDLRTRGESIKQIGSGISSAGKSLTMALTVPIMGAVTALGLFASKEAAYVEQIRNMSLYTGLTIQQLQEFKFITDHMGLSFETMTNSAIMFQRKLLGIEGESGMAFKALDRLGISAKEADGNFRPMNELFPEMITKLQGVENATLKNALATQLFGRGGKDILPIIGMQAAQYDEMKKKAHEFGVVLEGEGFEGMLKFHEGLEDLKAMFRGLFLALAQQILPILQKSLLPIIRDQILPAFKMFITHIGNAIAWFGKLSPAGRMIVLVLGAIAVSIGPVLVGIGMLISAIGTLATVSLTTLATPLGWIAAILGAIAVVVLGVAGAMTLFGDKTDRTTQKLIEQKEAALRDATASREEAQSKVNASRETVKLAEEYDKLRNKTKLTADEKLKMLNLENEIAKRSPDFVKAIDSQTGRFQFQKDIVHLANLELQNNINLLTQQIVAQARLQVELGKTAQQALPAAQKKLPANWAKQHIAPVKPGMFGMISAEEAAKQEKLVTGPSAEENAKNIAEVIRLQGLIFQGKGAALLLERIRKNKGRLPSDILNPPTTVTNVAPATTKGAAGKTAAQAQLEFIQAQIKTTEIGMDALGTSIKHALDSKDFAKAKDLLKQLNDQTYDMKSNYELLQHAEEAVGREEKNAVSRKAKMLDAQNEYITNTTQSDERYRSTKKSVDDAISKAESDRLKKSTAMNKQAWDVIEKANKEEVSKFQADEDLKIRIAKETGDELLAIQMEWQKTYRDELAKTGDEENSRKLADLQRTKAIAEYEESIRQRAFKTLQRTYELGHISYGEYIRSLKEMQSAYDEYSDQYKAIQNEIKSVTDDVTDNMVTAAVNAAKGNEKAAVRTLKAWLAALELVDGASAELIEAIKKAIADLENKSKEETHDIWDDWHAVIDSIKTAFVDAITAMIEGTSNFADFWKQVWHEIIRFAVTQLIILLQKWLEKRKQMQAAGLFPKAESPSKSFFGGLFSSLGKAAGVALGAAIFDNPINDTGAIRSGQDFGRLFTQGGSAELGGAFPKANFSPASASIINHNESVQITTKIDKVSGIDDLNRISEQQAWIIQKRLNLAPTSR